MGYSRRILLIALGTTPHLLTVTLAALYKKDPTAMPTEIHVLTTKKGAVCAREAFVEKQDGLLARFYADYGLPYVGVLEKNIHVMTGTDFTALDDIRTPKDGTGAADFIVALVRELCRDPDSMLTVSIVGGRKSMGLLLGSAMMFFGRDQDVVSHVLSKTEAPAGGEAYPSVETLRTDPEVVNLGEIPFLRLRPILPSALVSRQYHYSEIVEASQEQLAHRVTASVLVTRGKWRLFVDNVEVKPEKRSLGLYAWLLLRQKLGRTTMTSPAGVTLETFFLLRVQFVKVLERMLSEHSWQSACVQYVGLSAVRLHELLRQGVAQELVDDAAFYRWLQSVLTEAEREKVKAAAFGFVKKISICRTRFNDKLVATLSEAIPDVTRRRLGRALIVSNGDKEGVIYSLGLLSADLVLPRELYALVDGVTDHPALHWKTV